MCLCMYKQPFQNISIESLYAVASTINQIPDCFLTALKIHIDDFLKENTYVLHSSIMKHDTLFNHKATNIKEISLYVLKGMSKQR